jgi:hypothetical protein
MRVGRVIDFEAFRRDHRIEVVETPADEVLARLEKAIARLDPLVAEGTGRLRTGYVESELLAITGAVTAGSAEEAAERAERLAERLEHPSARAAR